MKKRVLMQQSDRRRPAPEKTREYVSKLSEMIGCKTVWTQDGRNNSEFERFYSVIEKCFPLVAKNARRLSLVAQAVKNPPVMQEMWV